MFELLSRIALENSSDPGIFRLLGFVSFRALMAGLTAMLISFIFGGRLIAWLTGLKFREEIRDDGPESHHKKAGTPTMGGLIILLSLSVACLLFGNFSNVHFTLLFICTLAMGGDRLSRRLFQSCIKKEKRHEPAYQNGSDSAGRL